MAKIRTIKEGRIQQGAGETVEYNLTTTPWGSSPSGTSAAIYDVADTSSNLASTLMTGSTSVSGDVITLPLIHSLTSGTNYRVEVTFTTGNSELVIPFIIEAED